MKQLSFEEMLYGQYKIDKPIRLIELFGGIGSQAKALERLGANFEHYKLVEFDPDPVASYNAIHGTNFEPADITKTKAGDLEITERNKYTYLLTYSFPCQDLSMAGKRKGMSKGSGTRSGLLWEVERLLNECGDNLPQVLLMENVKAILSKKTIADFNEWINYLQNKGYSNFYKVLNSKNYGIPQNRERCFMVSILGDAHYEFPEPIPLKWKLKDFLEDEVDEKYYLSSKTVSSLTKEDTKGFNRAERFYQTLENTNEKGIASTILVRQRTSPTDNYIVEEDKKSFGEVYDKIKSSSFAQNSRRIQETDICDTLCARDFKDPKCVIVSNNKRLNETIEKNELTDGCYIDAYNRSVKKDIAGTLQAGVDFRNNTFIAVEDKIKTLGNYSPSNHNASRIVDTDGIAPTVMENHGTVTTIAIKNATKKGYLEAEEGDGVDISSRMKYHRETVQKQSAQTLDTQCNIGVVVKDKPICQETPLRIRKLTPKECWRLMGFDDEDFEKAAKYNSNSKLYKQAGNSIVVNVLEAIFKQMLQGGDDDTPGIKENSI